MRDTTLPEKPCFIQLLLAKVLTYWKDTKTIDFICQGDKSADIAIYPDTITYPNNRYQIKFTWTSRQDYESTWWTNNNATQFFHRYILSNITVNHNADSDINGTYEQTIRKYELGYNSNLIYPNWQWSAGGKTPALVSILERGVNTTDTLPPYTFEYDGMHLSTARNGYGGKVVFVYDSPNPWAADQAPDDRKFPWNTNLATKCNNSGRDWDADPAVPGSDVHCYDKDGDNDYDFLKVTGGAYNDDIFANDSENISLSNFQPGAMYRFEVWVKSNSGGTIELGFFDEATQTTYYAPPMNMTSSVQILTSSAIQFPKTAHPDDIILKIRCSQTCYLNSYTGIRSPMRFRVQEKQLYSYEGATALTFSYEYGTPMINIDDPAIYDGGDNPYIEFNTEFRGHSWVEEISPNGLKTKTWFNQNDTLKGQPGLTLVYDQTGKLLQVTDPAWTVTDYSNTVGMPVKEDDTVYTGLFVTWAYKNSEETQTCDGENVCVKKKIVYEYLTADQGNGAYAGNQYGNLTRVFEQAWDSANSSYVNYRATRIWYAPNGDATYLVGLPAATNVYVCPSGACNWAVSDLLSSVLYIYDEHTNYTDLPTTGKLTDIRSLVDFLGPSGASRYSQVTYTYDTYGNQTNVKTWDSYGTTTTDPTTGERSTTNVYDDGNYHTYLTQIQNPKYSTWGNKGTSFSYDYARAVVTSMTDPNLNVISATYDNFGRILTIVKPGDTAGSPTVSFTYNDTNQTSIWPFGTVATQKIDSVTRMTVRKYYDGLGRLLQTQLTGAALNAQGAWINGAQLVDGACDQSPTGTEDKCDILVNTYYNAAGQPWRQTVPFARTTTTGFVTQDDPYTLQVAYTETLYDTLGRVSQVIGTDDATTSYAYAIHTSSQTIRTTVTDPEGGSTVTHTDTWGRTIEVHPPINPWTKYIYNAANQLKEVEIYNASNSLQGETILAYNLAGWKTSMNDMDMGDWQYTYDALGNLKTQNDARDCLTTFTYDTLGRLTTKDYSNTCSSTFDVSYSYDSEASGNEGLGFRTGMLDNSGTTTWFYDTRGRLKQETKAVSGEGTFKTLWSYNSADMLSGMTYPSNNTSGTGEALTFNYLPQGTLDQVDTSYSAMDYYLIQVATFR